ncbi:MAG: hypothetical protein J7L95_00105 [Prolixibacteraceae bacterium]|nr:hypothetical protein [Prolixibacteraceae bacterium]
MSRINYLVVVLFVFKKGSRNAFDNNRKEAGFRKTTGVPSSSISEVWARWMTCSACWQKANKKSNTN